MNKKAINAVYLVDNNAEQLLMLGMSLQTLVLNTNVKCVTIAYVDVQKETVISVVKSALHKFPSCVEICYFPLQYALVDQFFPSVDKFVSVVNRRLYYSSLIRWFLHRIPLDKFWYVDTDVLFQKDTQDILSFENYEEYMFVAFNRKDYSDSFYNTGIGTIKETSDLNAGVLYMNADKIRNSNVFEDVINFYRENVQSIKYMNQTAYTFLFEKYANLCKIIIDNRYNSKIWNTLDYDLLVEYIKIHHITGQDKSLFFKVFNSII